MNLPDRFAAASSYRRLSVGCCRASRCSKFAGHNPAISAPPSTRRRSPPRGTVCKAAATTGFFAARPSSCAADGLGLPRANDKTSARPNTTPNLVRIRTPILNTPSCGASVGASGAPECIQECAYAVASASREGAARREPKGVPHGARAEALIVIAASALVESRNVLGAGYSTLIFANLITLAHFSVSSAMSLPKSAGEPESTSRSRATLPLFGFSEKVPCGRNEAHGRWAHR